MIVPYAVVRPEPGETMVHGLAVHRHGPVGVLVEETPEPPAPTREAVLEHGRRIAAIGEHRALLPMRYGTVLADADQLETLAAERAEAWSRRLSVVAGHAELVVHVVPARPSGGRAASGREHLRRRAEELHRHDRAWAGVEALVREWSRELRRLPDGQRMAVLVPHEHVAAMRDAVVAWSADHDDVEVAVTGPWPPYSFCDEPEES